MRLDVALSQLDPAVASILGASVREHDVDIHATNLVGTPVFMRIGAEDVTVHPYYSRRLYRVLHQLAHGEHGVLAIAEVPGYVHRVGTTSLKRQRSPSSCFDGQEATLVVGHACG